MTLYGNPIDYLVVFLGGIAVSFSPCVYPFIPVTIGAIGIEAGVSRMRGFALSFTYVTGIAVTYAVLGLFASLTATVFGTVSAHPLTNIAVGLIIILLGLFMLDLFKINIKSPIKASQVTRRGFFAIFMLGLVSGLVIGPCTTPVLSAILAYLFTKKNIFYGATLLLSFAYGMGLLLILCGTFSSILLALPKTEKFSVYIKRFAAILLIGGGIYFIFSGIGRF